MAQRAGQGKGNSIGAQGVVLPSILGTIEHCRAFATIATLLADIDDRGVLPNGGGVQEVTDAVLGWLATYDHLGSIGNHPDRHMLADEPLGTKGKGICKRNTAKPVRKRT